ncbi:uncharacterized protein L201_004054 [Kwoniella dendrophila CBS 6074]|uniref:Uncharacterized protein n=1 Tax=Kwoniella dendrophila CBS 6074 TaxID=1295534 RepID=A0AAX4JV85_9TREE
MTNPQSKSTTVVNGNNKPISSKSMVSDLSSLSSSDKDKDVPDERLIGKGKKRARASEPMVNGTALSNDSPGKSSSELSDLDIQRPPKKKRGRPSRISNSINTPSKLEDNNDSPKKKRGRPSKVNGDTGTPKVISKTKAEVEVVKDDSHDDEIVVATDSRNTSEMTDLTELELESGETKKKRGRPSLKAKAKAGISPTKKAKKVDDENDNAQTPKKKRGRPSKLNGDEIMINQRESIVATTPKEKKSKLETSTPKGITKDGKPKKKTGPKPKNIPVVEIEKKKKGNINKEDLKEKGSKNHDLSTKKKKKTVKDDKAKEKGKEMEKKIKLKLKKPEIIPETPIFEKVYTKLGKEEAEQRIMLREYLFRFRATLSFSERALPAIDDFDRPLTEASVRLFAGSMLDMIKDELQSTENQDLVNTLFNVREELRYYADLARFQGIYNLLSEPLSLKLPPPIIDHRAEANNTALREILDLSDNQPSPTWATESGPLKRTGASRIPQPYEIIRMLLGLAERTLTTPKIKNDMEYLVPENDFRRKHNSAIKKELLDIESKKKKLNETILKSKSPAETKTNKEQFNKEMHEHKMRLDLINVNLEAQLARRALRHEPLGRDLNGRIYYVLSPRLVEDDVKPPLAWASGLLVWGKGVEPKINESTSTTTNGNANGVNPISNNIDIEYEVEKWYHFGKSKNVKLLIDWLEYKFKKHIESLKPSKTPIKTKSTIASTPSKKSSKNETPSKSKLKQKTLLEVVIPISSSRKNLMNNVNGSGSGSTPLSAKVKALGEGENDNNINIDDGDDDLDKSSTSSGLTPPPRSSKEELLSSLNPPKDYKPSTELLEENHKILIENLRNVHRWLEVLEWQGFGEVGYEK